MEGNEIKLDIDEQKYTIVQDSNLVLNRDIKKETDLSDNIIAEQSNTVVENSALKLEPNDGELDSKEGICHEVNFNIVEEVCEENGIQNGGCRSSGMKMHDVRHVYRENYSGENDLAHVSDEKMLNFNDINDSHVVTVKSEYDEDKDGVEEKIFIQEMWEDLNVSNTSWNYAVNVRHTNSMNKLDLNVPKMDKNEGIYRDTAMNLVEEVCKENREQDEDRLLSGMEIHDISHVYHESGDDLNDLAYITNERKFIIDNFDGLVPEIEKTKTDEDKNYQAQNNIKKETFEDFDVGNNEGNFKFVNIKNITDGIPIKDNVRTHNKEKAFQCQFCSKSCKTKKYLKIHLRTHTGEKPYQCEVCKRSFSSGYTLKSHIRTHTGEKPYKCDLCNSCFSQSNSLVSHKRTHTGEKPYKCKECDKSFIESSKLRLHMRTHTGEKPFKCNVCNKNFIHTSSLAIHKRTHTGEKPYTCKVCNKSFRQSGTLITHMRSHTGETPYKCDVCDKSFSESGKLKLHIWTHIGEKPYKCEVCGKGFNYNHGLVRHMMAHNDDRPYKCDVCYKTFIQNYKLKRHMATHTGEKPHTCEVCSRSFSVIANLNRHMLTHTVEIPYKCEVCHNTCLIRRPKTHTDEEPFVCKYCNKTVCPNDSLVTHMRTVMKKLSSSQ